MCVGVCVGGGMFILYIREEKKRSEHKHEKQEPEEDGDARMGFKRAFHILLHYPRSDKMGQLNDIYSSLQSLARETETNHIYL